MYSLAHTGRNSRGSSLSSDNAASRGMGAWHKEKRNSARTLLEMAPTLPRPPAHACCDRDWHVRPAAQWRTSVKVDAVRGCIAVQCCLGGEGSASQYEFCCTFNAHAPSGATASTLSRSRPLIAHVNFFCFDLQALLHMKPPACDLCAQAPSSGQAFATGSAHPVPAHVPGPLGGSSKAHG